jgi:hypothetical protein
LASFSFPPAIIYLYTQWLLVAGTLRLHDYRFVVGYMLILIKGITSDCIGRTAVGKFSNLFKSHTA